MSTISRHCRAIALKSRLKWGSANGRTATVAMDHLKKEIETGEKEPFRSLATIKLPDHIMVAINANMYPECTWWPLIDKGKNAKDGQ